MQKPALALHVKKRRNAIAKTRGERVFDFFNTLFMVFVCLVTIYPFWYVLVLSFNTGQDAAAGPIWFWPREFTLDNYKYVFQYEALQRAFGVTLARCAVGSVLNVGVTLLAAYALSKRTLPGRKAIIFFFMLPMFIGGSVISNYVVFVKLNLLNNFLVYVIPGCFTFFNMVIMRTFIEGIPTELEESAWLDGASFGVSFIKIILPLCKPVVAAMLFFAVVHYWLDLYTNLLYVTKKELQVLQYVLYQVINSSEASRFVDMSSMGAAIERRLEQSGSGAALPTPEVIKMTVMVVVTFPLLFVYPFFQKYFVKGMLVGAVKA